MQSPHIILATLNARYSHASFGLRYLRANLGRWRDVSVIREFTINQLPLDICEALLAENPTILAFGVYIWNVSLTTEVLELVRKVRPALTIILGGPEVSYELDEQPITALADHIITGEADISFRTLIDALMRGEKSPTVISAELPSVHDLVLPYSEYTDEDLRQRLIYVEASRGCPFRCEFCLSSLDIPVRAFPLESFLASLSELLSRGARAFKFVDRTFNLNIKVSAAILQFCLDHYVPGFELHFEMIPDRLPEELRTLITKFPPGAIQFEIGIQTLTPEVSRLISRPLHLERMRDNFHFLRSQSGVHIHADLIVGLPGETLETFGKGFDLLIGFDPDEIQIGILKRLRGTPIRRHSIEYQMVYHSRPPYEILLTSTIPFEAMQRMKRFARYFELYHNSGNFVSSIRYLYSLHHSAFEAFLDFSDWLFRRTAQTHQFALVRLFELLFTYLTEIKGQDPTIGGKKLLNDYDRPQIRRERLEFLSTYVESIAPPRTETRRSDIHGNRDSGSSQPGLDVGRVGGKRRGRAVLRLHPPVQSTDV